MKDATNWTQRSALWSFFFTEKTTPNFGFCACSPRAKKQNKTGFWVLLWPSLNTEIWLSEASVIEERTIRNIWKETLFSSMRRLAFCTRPLSCWRRRYVCIYIHTTVYFVLYSLACLLTTLYFCLLSVLFTVQNTDPQCYWLTNWVEVSYVHFQVIYTVL